MPSKLGKGKVESQSRSLLRHPAYFSFLRRNSLGTILAIASIFI